jgi:hypothetical protein
VPARTGARRATALVFDVVRERCAYPGVVVSGDEPPSVRWPIDRDSALVDVAGAGMRVRTVRVAVRDAAAAGVRDAAEVPPATAVPVYAAYGLRGGARTGCVVARESGDLRAVPDERG